jgi:hypothetical protein
VHTPRSRDPRSRPDDRAGEDGFGASDPLTDLSDLLAAMGCQTTDELNLMLYGAFELDPSLVEARPEKIVVAVRDRVVALAFPFSLEEFWTSVDQLEGEVERRLETPTAAEHDEPDRQDHH